MRCPTCGTELVERLGKFGPFICCPKSKPGENHGTFSRQGSTLYFTGSVGEALKPSLPPRYTGPPTLSLRQQIDWMTNNMAPGGTARVDFLVEPSDDVALSRNQIDELNYPDDWRNQRPY